MSSVHRYVRCFFLGGQRLRDCAVSSVHGHVKCFFLGGQRLRDCALSQCGGVLAGICRRC